MIFAKILWGSYALLRLIIFTLIEKLAILSLKDYDQRAKRGNAGHMLNLFLVAIGGAFGCVSRYGLGLWVQNVWPNSNWPYATFAANVLGGLFMGLLMGLIAGPLKEWGDAERLRITLGVGVLGGFTTFSTFSLEVITMFERKSYGLATGYMLASVMTSIIALLIGLMIMRKIGL